MSIRPAIAFLLLISMTLTAVGRASPDPLPDETDETRLTFDEELEARSVVEQFVKRFEETDDLLSIVDDLYVRDFGDRLRRDPAERFIVPIDSQLAASVEGDELRRCHITMLKFSYLYMMLLASAWHSSGGHLNGDVKPFKDDDENVPRPHELLPPRVVALLKNDPALAEMLLEESKSADAPEKDSGGKDEDRDLTIKTIERLRSYNSTVEQAVSMMREHLRTLPVPQTWQGMMELMRGPDQETGSAEMTASATPLATDYFGCPKGTRLICIKALPFHMDLIRVDGQLKILSVYVADD